MEECEVLSAKPTRTPGSPEQEKDTNSPALGVQEASKFRGVAARINYFVSYRADLQFAAKDLCRKMAAPTENDWARARRVAI